jgi:hypothetical protein
MSQTLRYAVNRNPGETYHHFARRASAAHLDDALRAKVHEGRWLPADEYQRIMGRPGRAVPPCPAPNPTPSTSNNAPAARPDPRASEGARVAVGIGQTAAVSAVVSVVLDVVRDGAAVDLRATAGRALGSAAHSAATGTLQHGAARCLATTALSTATRATLNASVLGPAAGLAVSLGADTFRVARGELSGNEFLCRAGGHAADATVGAVAGAVGMALGGPVGAFVLGTAGSALCRWLRG